MEFSRLFSILEGIVEDIPQLLYDTLRNKMREKRFKKRAVLVEIGQPIIHFYYLHKGIASACNASGNLIWFCEENEIIVLHTSQLPRGSSYEITIGKGSTVYQISLRTLYDTVDNNLVDRMLMASKNTFEYFMNLNGNMKSQSIAESIKLISQNHEKFSNSSLTTLSAFIGASEARVSTARKKLRIK